MSRKDIAIIDFDDAALKRVVIGAIKAARGLHWFTLTRCRNQRSLAQNAFWHGVICKHAQAAISEAWGENLSHERTHSLLKEMFLREPVVDRNTGEVKGWTTGTTTELDTKEMTNLIEQAMQWLFQTFDIVISPPDLTATP